MNVVAQKVGVFWIHLYKQSLQYLPRNSYISPTCVIYTFESVAHSLSLVWIPYGIIFVACYLYCSEWFLLRISGPHGPRRGPRGPKGPLAQNPRPGPGPFHWGPGPWARPGLLGIGKARREKTLCICSGRCVQTGRRVSAERIEST